MSADTTLPAAPATDAARSAAALVAMRDIAHALGTTEEAVNERAAEFADFRRYDLTLEQSLLFALAEAARAMTRVDRIRLALSDPGSILPREKTPGGWWESAPSWASRAVTQVLREGGAS